MEWLIETINPAKIVPVHTQSLEWSEERWPKRTVAAKYAEPLTFGE